MDPILRLRALSRIGLFMALGALTLGIVGVGLMWTDTTGSFARVAIVLLIPGAFLLVQAGYVLGTVFSAKPENWKAIYLRAARILTTTAMVSGVGIVVAAVFASQSASILQAILISIVAAQGPAASILIAKYLKNAK